MAERDALAGSVVEPPEPSPTLADAGIDKKLSAMTQRMAFLRHRLKGFGVVVCALLHSIERKDLSY